MEGSEVWVRECKCSEVYAIGGKWELFAVHGFLRVTSSSWEGELMQCV
jgi:hypothetical protein